MISVTRVNKDHLHSIIRLRPNSFHQPLKQGGRIFLPLREENESNRGKGKYEIERTERKNVEREMARVVYPPPHGGAHQLVFTY